MNLIQNYEMWAAREEREERKDALLKQYDNPDFVKNRIATVKKWDSKGLNDDDTDLLYEFIVIDAFDKADDIGVELDDSDIEYISYKVAAVLEA